LILVGDQVGTAIDDKAAMTSLQEPFCEGRFTCVDAGKDPQVERSVGHASSERH
jgi:hypothetical protein